MTLHDNVSHILATKLNETIEPLCQGYSDYALLDFPAYSNVGDSAIYLGELALLDKIFSKPPSYVCTKKAAARDLNKFSSKAIIFLNGGGNFGDLWPAHQKFREKILRMYPDRKVVQLPQSIHFSSKESIPRTAEAIAKHKDFTLLVRDHESFNFAQTHFDCDVQLCPDAAYALRDIKSDQSNITRDVLCLLRTDKENNINLNDLDILKTLGPIEDWISEPSVKTYADRIDGFIYACVPGARKHLMVKKEQMFRRHAQIRLNRGTAQLQSATKIISDRLHVHILSMIMQKDHFVLDNSYNKVKNFIYAWSKDDTTHIVEDLSQLRHQILSDASTHGSK